MHGHLVLALALIIHHRVVGGHLATLVIAQDDLHGQQVGATIAPQSTFHLDECRLAVHLDRAEVGVPVVEHHTLSQDEFDRADAKPADKQIAREITYFRDMYETLKPVVYLSYDREAFFGKDDKGFRITFDRNIMYRTDRLSLSEDPGGLKLIGEDQSLMEVKLGGGMPLWLAGFLSDKHIFKASFSKYGAAYKDMVKRGEVNVSDI